MSENPLRYDDLKLRIEQSDEGTYRVRATGPGDREVGGTFRVPFSPAELENFVLRVGLARTRTRAYKSPQMEEAKRLGSMLFDALVQGDVRDLYRTAHSAAEKDERGLRVTLNLTEVPELMSMPWELLYDRPKFLSQSIYTPLVRSLDMKIQRSPRKLTLPLQILGLVSQPTGHDELDVAQERRKLDEALKVPTSAGLVRLDWLERATLSELHRKISAPGEIHVLHYIGHGGFDEHRGHGVLILENERGGAHEVTGEELGSMLSDQHSLRLVVLNSCQGARTSATDPFTGVATSLVEHGLPAVVGMQFEISDDAAIAFAESLYTDIARGRRVDTALAHTRKAIFAAGHDVEFSTPVLFLRAPDGAKLFEVETPPEPGPIGPTATPDTSVRADHTPAGGQPNEGTSGRPLTHHGRPPSPPGPTDEGRGTFPAPRAPALTRQQFVATAPLGTKKAAEVIADGLEDGEVVFKVAEVTRGGLFGSGGLLVATDRRLIFPTRQGHESWVYEEITEFQVSTGAATTRIVLRLRNSQDVELTSLFQKSNVTDLAEFVVPMLGADNTRLLEPPPPTDVESWAAELFHSTQSVRYLRVQLGVETHVITYTCGFWNTLQLDGQIAYRTFGFVREYELSLTDGANVYPARIAVTAQGATTVASFSLEVAGKMLHRS
uniref:CHAT domain-containing protein n=1 Tax=Streptomyces sp. NBC_00049 TaxID=2903617 RepID=A0AAU2K2M7_9ACTN